MSDNTKIEWAQATWNPLSGCTEVSPGCDHCYAKTFAERWRGTPGHYYEHGFDLQLRPEKLDQPLRWKRPRRIFVNSMSDLFHDQVPDEYIGSVFDVMARAERHTFQVLTKRHARMRSLLRKWEGQARADEGLHPNYRHAAWRRSDKHWCTPRRWPLPNVWLGVSAENQQWADIRIPALLDTPAAVRFVSAEPLLGPIDLLGDVEHPGPAIIRTGVHTPGGPWGPDEFDYDDQIGIDWVIVGGESGRTARPMHPQWARDIRDQCESAGVAFLHKQNGEWIEDVTIRPAEPEFGIHEPYRLLNIPPDHKNPKRCVMHLGGGTALTPDNPFNPFHAGHPGWTAMRRVGKKAAGRELDGRTWDQYPEAVVHA